MQAVFNHLDFFLNFQETFSLKHAARTAITVKRGIVWVTQDGHREDHVLEAGQTLMIRDDDAVVFSAMQPAEVAIQEGRRHTAATQLWRTFKARYLRTMRARAVLWQRGDGYSRSLRWAL
jgi:Protein of unknown function (DUF2917)